MKNKILWIVTFIPTIVTAIVLKIMPDQVPMHYDAAGNIDRWGSKYENFIFPVIIIGMTLFKRNIRLPRSVLVRMTALTLRLITYQELILMTFEKFV